VYGVPLNHKSKTEDFSLSVFQSVSRATTVNIKAPPMGSGFRSHEQVLVELTNIFRLKFGEEYKDYEAPHDVIFSTLKLLPLSSIQN
jgi:hypothetical protein